MPTRNRTGRTLKRACCCSKSSSIAWRPCGREFADHRRRSGLRQGLVVAAGGGAGVEDAVFPDPLHRFLEHLARVGLEDEALARSPAARIHARVEAVRELLEIV